MAVGGTRRRSRKARSSRRASRSVARRALRVSKKKRRTKRGRKVRRSSRRVRQMRGGAPQEVILGFFDHPEEADDACAILNLCSWAMKDGNHLMIFYGGKAIDPGKPWISENKQKVGVPDLLAWPSLRSSLPIDSDRVPWCTSTEAKNLLFNALGGAPAAAPAPLPR